jgi:hypothetical protein
MTSLANQRCPAFAGGATLPVSCSPWSSSLPTDEAQESQTPAHDVRFTGALPVMREHRRGTVPVSPSELLPTCEYARTDAMSMFIH